MFNFLQRRKNHENGDNRENFRPLSVHYRKLDLKPSIIEVDRQVL